VYGVTLNHRSKTLTFCFSVFIVLAGLTRLTCSWLHDDRITNQWGVRTGIILRLDPGIRLHILLNSSLDATPAVTPSVLPQNLFILARVVSSQSWWTLTRACLPCRTSLSGWCKWWWMAKCIHFK
jgi:hypothetical protein